MYMVQLQLNISASSSQSTLQRSLDPFTFSTILFIARPAFLSEPPPPNNLASLIFNNTLDKNTGVTIFLSNPPPASPTTPPTHSSWEPTTTSLVTCTRTRASNQCDPEDPENVLPPSPNKLSLVWVVSDVPSNEIGSKAKGDRNAFRYSHFGDGGDGGKVVVSSEVCEPDDNKPKFRDRSKRQQKFWPTTWYLRYCCTSNDALLAISIPEDVERDEFSINGGGRRARR
ncbi:hypothetical protein K435DRAFT_872185 [Dendrothele bispora CBS 962.96]|uniref:Uncharacterized protein n=1 Tax=Dendrothele bispora (strain CBS 962.96) TaxID=1314807 RepID=A0A4S8L281_DENBC|nr:hypothetical protein K435DRAFT_872185 [Dendrothele bispora CBS 962.96]